MVPPGVRVDRRLSPTPNAPTKQSRATNPPSTTGPTHQWVVSSRRLDTPDWFYPERLSGVYMKVYPCPLCGRWKNRQGAPFTEESQTMDHITRTADATHRDERGEAYWGKIDPTDVDDPSVDGESDAGRSRPMRGVSIDPDREPMPVIEAIEENGARIRELEALVEENATLRARVDELERLVETMRGDVAGLYASLETDVKGRHVAWSSTDERGWVPESVDPSDPTGAFDDERDRELSSE
jgi:hypothetical protein